MLRQISALSTIAATPPRSLRVHDVVAACELLRKLLGAEDAYGLRAGDPYFVRLGADDQTPGTYEIKQRGYWMVWKELAANPLISASIFTVEDRFVRDAVVTMELGRPASHVATILPASESNSEVLVVRGPWPNGLSEEHMDVITAVRPIFAYLVGSVLDAERHERQRFQLGALSEVSAAFSEAEEMGDVLAALATAIAKASEFDWVNINLVDETVDHIVEAVQNVARYSETDTARVYGGASSGGSIQAGMLRMIRRLAESRVPYLQSDVFALDARNESDLELQRFYQRAHILSTASFPILFQEHVLGSVVFSASTSHEFDHAEVEFLTALVSQAATTVKALRLNAELREADQRLAPSSRTHPYSFASSTARALSRSSKARASTPVASPTSPTSANRSSTPTSRSPGRSRSNSRRASKNASRAHRTPPADAGAGAITEAQYAPLRDDAGVPTGAICVALDVTERVRAERDLLELNSRL